MRVVRVVDHGSQGHQLRDGARIVVGVVAAPVDQRVPHDPGGRLRQGAQPSPGSGTHPGMSVDAAALSGRVGRQDDAARGSLRGDLETELHARALNPACGALDVPGQDVGNSASA